MSAPTPPSPAPQPKQQQPEGGKTKEEALQACAGQHHALVSCFKDCGLGSAFTGCCTEEHKTFWECYTSERGTNQTRITSWLDGIFGGGGSSSTAPAAAIEPPQQQPR